MLIDAFAQEAITGEEEEGKCHFIPEEHDDEGFVEVRETLASQRAPLLRSKLVRVGTVLPSDGARLS